jgi:hypothetical protein
LGDSVVVDGSETPNATVSEEVELDTAVAMGKYRAKCIVL